MTSREGQARPIDVAPVWVGGRGPGSRRAKLPRYPSSAFGDSEDDKSAPARRAGPLLQPFGPRAPRQVQLAPPPNTTVSSGGTHTHAWGSGSGFLALMLWGAGLGAVTAQV